MTITSSTLDTTPHASTAWGAVSNAATLPTPSVVLVPAGSSPNGAKHEDSIQVSGPRVGSRMDRMAQPLLREALTTIAEHYGVCVRPVPIRRIDRHTRETTVLDVPCGARLASKCKPCAEKGRRLRQQQIREGWHLTAEPTPAPEPVSEEVKAAVQLRCAFAFDREQSMREADWDQVRELDRAIDELDETMSGMRVRGSLPHPAQDKPVRKARSTKRRTDAGELPRLPVATRTVGKVYQTAHGKAFQPSTLLTVTLTGYGEVHTGPRTRRGQLIPCTCGVLHGQQDSLLGTPMNPATYDYRRAALDSIFFAAVLDRFWQNLRRSAGWKVQYAGSVEMQKRLAVHAHFAMRGTLPRALLKQVAAATYHQVWWPPFDKPAYSVDKPPVWDDETSSYLDPKTKTALTTWAQAVNDLDNPDTEPSYVAKLGQIDAKGITPGTKDADRAIRYVTKYVTKDLIEQANPHSDEQKIHHDRLHIELSTLPCSPICANWLLYAVQPDKAKKGLAPGRCSGKVHQRTTLGFTGRRVLISRQWSGKTLTDHRGDQREWVRTVISGAFADNEHPGDNPYPGRDCKDRYAYRLARPDDPDVAAPLIRIMNSVAVRTRWKDALRQALSPPDPRSGNTDQQRESSSTMSRREERNDQ